MVTENYKIITDEVLLDSFIESLPELTEDEVFYVCLFARSKYLTEEQKGSLTHIKSDKAQLKRFSATKATLKTKLRQLECPIGSYVQYKTNVPSNPVPQESLAVYITINPRSLRKTNKNCLKKFVEMVVDNPTHPFNPTNFSMSELQRSPSKKRYFILDIDEKDVSLYKVKEFLGETPTKVIETRGGYHVLIDVQNIDKTISKTWYYNVKNFLGENLDQGGDIMSPIVGTYQGGWTPKFI